MSGFMGAVAGRYKERMVEHCRSSVNYYLPFVFNYTHILVKMARGHRRKGKETNADTTMPSHALEQVRVAVQAEISGQ